MIAPSFELSLQKPYAWGRTALPLCKPSKMLLLQWWVLLKILIKSLHRECCSSLDAQDKHFHNNSFACFIEDEGRERVSEIHLCCVGTLYVVINNPRSVKYRKDCQQQRINEPKQGHRCTCWSHASNIQPRCSSDSALDVSLKLHYSRRVEIKPFPQSWSQYLNVAS